MQLAMHKQEFAFEPLAQDDSINDASDWAAGGWVKAMPATGHGGSIAATLAFSGSGCIIQLSIESIEVMQVCDHRLPALQADCSDQAPETLRT